MGRGVRSRFLTFDYSFSSVFTLKFPKLPCRAHYSRSRVSGFQRIRCFLSFSFSPSLPNFFSLSLPPFPASATCHPLELVWNHRARKRSATGLPSAGLYETLTWLCQGCNCRPLSVIRACGTARWWTASFTDPAGTTEPYKHYRIRCLILGLSPAMPTPRPERESADAPRFLVVANLPLTHRTLRIEWNCMQMFARGKQYRWRGFYL